MKIVGWASPTNTKYRFRYWWAKPTLRAVAEVKNDERMLAFRVSAFFHFVSAAAGMGTIAPSQITRENFPW